MKLQINSILIGVSDIARSKKFYGEGLGCAIEQDYPQFVSFGLGDGSSKLGLYTSEALAADAGVAAAGSGFRRVTFNCIVTSTAEVDEVLAQAERSGAKIVRAAEKVQWGCFGYFSDPDGHLWKVAAGQ